WRSASHSFHSPGMTAGWPTRSSGSPSSSPSSPACSTCLTVARSAVRCEVVAVGTELLLGQIVDTNSSWIGEQLALVGIDSHFQTKVGDNFDRIVLALRTALARSDAVIVSGGIGPTQDDITREAIAEVMNVPLRRDEDMVETIRAFFGARGREMAASNAEGPNGLDHVF